MFTSAIRFLRSHLWLTSLTIVVTLALLLVVGATIVHPNLTNWQGFHSHPNAINWQGFHSRPNLQNWQGLRSQPNVINWQN